MLAQRHRELAFPDLNEFRLNRLGLFCSETYKWDMASTAACECDEKEQTAEHVLTSCLIYHHPNGACVLPNVSRNLADGNMSGHSVDHPVPVHLHQTKSKKNKIIFKDLIIFSFATNITQHNTLFNIIFEIVSKKSNVFSPTQMTYKCMSSLYRTTKELIYRYNI